MPPLARVLLLREPAPDWRRGLEARAYEPRFLPVLAFRPQAEGRLQLALCRAQHAGLLLASPRAAEACAAACPQGLPPSWRDKPVFVVGPATAAIVAERLRLPTRGSESGNAEDLSDFIISQRRTFDNDKPLLFPCGNLKRDALPAKLKAADVLLDCLTVYSTSTRENLDSDLARLKNEEGIPDIVVFFSPSGVDSTIPILNSLGYDYENSNLIAIGPSTEKQIIKWNLIPAGAAASPTVDGILDVLASFSNSQY